MMYKFYKWAGLLFLALFLSCVHGPRPFYYIDNNSSAMSLKTYKVWIDKDFGDGDLIAIDNAVNQWNVALNGWIKLEMMSIRFRMEDEDTIKRVTSGEGWLILKVNSSNPIIHDDPSGKTLGVVNEIGGNRMWIVRDRLPNDWVTGVTLHEIGHLLGSEHVGNGLMSPFFDVNHSECIDQDAMEEIAKYNNIDINTLKYCIYGERPN